jgi:hypothetical protein
LHLGALDVGCQRFDPTLQDAESRFVRRLFGTLEEHLHTDAYSEERALGVEDRQNRVQ